MGRVSADAALAVGDALPALGLPGLDTQTGTHVVYFMRTADCPVCQRHVRRLSELQAQITASGADVTIVVPDGPEEAAALSARLGLPFPVVASSGAHGTVGLVPKVFGQLQQSGTVVASGGRVTHVRTATVPLRAFDEEAVLAALPARP